MLKATKILFFILFLFLGGISVTAAFSMPRTESTLQVENALSKKKKNKKGYKRPKSKKFLGIFKRKTDCGCPNK